MKRDEFRQSSEDQISDGELFDDALGKASADYYDRSWKNRLKIQKPDIWIAVGLYLVLSSVAFVLLI